MNLITSCSLQVGKLAQLYAGININNANLKMKTTKIQGPKKGKKEGERRNVLARSLSSNSLQLTQNFHNITLHH